MLPNKPIEDMNSIKKTARVAGLLYLLGAITAPFVLIYIPSALIVHGDATATANNIRSSELLFRAGIFSSLIGQVVSIFLVLILYRLFKEISRMQALIMVALVVASASIAFLNTFNHIAVLIILSGTDFLSVFEKPQLDALAYLFLRLNNHSYQAIEIFWGLWLFPFGLLVYKSRFIPKILGVLLIIAGFAYLPSSFTSLVLPQYKDIVSQLMTPLYFGELPIIFWLLIKGVKDQS